MRIPLKPTQPEPRQPERRGLRQALALGGALLLALGAQGCLTFGDDDSSGGLRVSGCRNGARKCARCGVPVLCEFGPEDAYVCRGGDWELADSCPLGKTCNDGYCEDRNSTYAQAAEPAPWQCVQAAPDWCGEG
ncbi:MAG: hypothetical protein KC613_19150 [Myxococcales bacterium]|nr:hypothetical protein [Myxococcales bacterium]MCB9526288.1 hypothetical protein [Myxococcales bacterium]